jgi:hypothetical protein
VHCCKINAFDLMVGNEVLPLRQSPPASHRHNTGWSLTRVWSWQEVNSIVQSSYCCIIMLTIKGATAKSTGLISTWNSCITAVPRLCQVGKHFMHWLLEHVLHTT